MTEQQPAGGPTFQSPRDAKAQAKADKAYRKAQRPWYKKKRFILPLILLLIIIFAVALGGGGDDGGTTTSTPAEQAPAEDEAPAEDAAPAFPGAQESDVVGQAGEELALGDVTITSAPLAEGDDTLGPTLCTAVTVTNDSDETIDFNALDWKLQAPTGTILNATVTGSENILSAGQIAPGGSTSGDVCFDAQDPQPGQYVVIYEPVFSFFSDRAAWINER